VTGGPGSRIGRAILDEQVQRRSARFDAILAVGLAAVFVPITVIFADGWAGGDRAIDVLASVLVAAAFLVLAFRRTRPVLTLAVVTGCVTWYLWAAYPYGPILGAFFIAVYTNAATLPFRRALIVTVPATALMLSHVFVHPSALGGWLGLIPGAAWAVVPFAIGVSVRAARQSRTAERDEALRQHLYDQRLELAQEVHDVVGHGLAAIQLQADIALHVDEVQPPRTRQALEAISRASKAAFDELASTLDAIHPQRRPSSPGIDDVAELCGRLREAGVDVEVTVDRRSTQRDEQVELAAYRVVQEALTNVIRHGDAKAAVVTIEENENGVHVVVTNPGSFPPPTGTGTGIEGMRRRVGGLGGQLDAGPGSSGFTVEAHIPHGGHR
jgi:signal transduction histidine kinase